MIRLLLPVYESTDPKIHRQLVQALIEKYKNQDYVILSIAINKKEK